MALKEARVSEIETYLHSKLKASGVSTHVYAAIPAALGTDVDEFVVLDVANNVYDKGAYAHTAVNIYLYAKPNKSGFKNVAKLEKMEEAFETFLKDSDSESYSIVPIYSKAGYNASYNFHYVFEAINLIIK
jgi:hypothetical protein